MSNQTKTYLLVSACVIQILVLLGMVIGVNYIYLTGSTYVIKATGYDPYDPLRGRYIQLNICEEVLPLKSNEEVADMNIILGTDKPLYAVFDTKERDGKLVYCTFDKPVDKNYLKVDRWHTYSEESSRLICYFNTEEYYVNERMAEEIETKIRNTEEVYLQIQVNKGIYVVKKLLIDGESY